MKIYNDLSRRKEELIPQEDGLYRIYVCGPTVYDFFHLGNARPFIIFDVLRRYLLHQGNKLRYVQNFTDIDDKMINRAQAEGTSIFELAERMIGEYFTDADGLGVMRADAYPRATEVMPEIIEMIAVLEEKGYAYCISDGVYFDTSRFAAYGKLSHHPMDELEEGGSQRVGQKDEKRSPMDFVLWKFKKENEPYWHSPWGEGRPGWHIECSAMNKKYLGDTVDIHGGGQDLIFPHHENEIAQSEAANGKPFVRYWMHNGFINVNNEKMAKSEGNFFLVRELAELYSYDVIRFFMLQAHYRMPINFSRELLDAAEHGWERIRTSIVNLDFILEKLPAEGSAEKDSALRQAVSAATEAFREGMDDDLNTAEAFAAIFELVREINSCVATAEVGANALRESRACLLGLCGIMGLNPVKSEVIPAEVLRLSEERADAKKRKDFPTADRLRQEIQALGWRVEDTAQGPRLTPLLED